MSIQESDRESAAVATHPRVSLADIEAAIRVKFEFRASEATEALFHAVTLLGKGPLDTLSVCILEMKNGFTVIGKAAPASPENFNRELGRKFAYEDAIRQLWPLMGYSLRDQLSKRKPSVP